MPESKNKVHIGAAGLTTARQIAACVVLAACFFLAGGRAMAVEHVYASVNDVTWTTLGHDENDSMPIGNGDLAANVWTEQNGDLVMLVAKSDAWTELGKMVKLGRIRISMSPNPFAGAAQFAQQLRLEDGTVEVRNGGNVLRVWVDANRPVLHVEGKFARATKMQAKLEMWRMTTHPYNDPSPDKGGMFEFSKHPLPLDIQADTVVPAGTKRVEWYHFNRESIYPLVLQHEHLEELAGKFPDPLLHRCFGAVMTGAGMTTVDGKTLTATAAGESQQLELVALTQPPATTPQVWQAEIDSLLRKVNSVPLETARAAHRKWWSNFWERSWVHNSGTADAEKVSQGYIMQRYMMAACSRGPYPAKYNGGLFTVGHDMPANVESSIPDHDPDYRSWGNSYWNQNNRLLYWPLLATGDYDLLRPWFSMYVDALPLAKARTRIYYHHDGAAFIETMNFWGLPNISDFGWDNPTNQVESRYMRYHIQGGLEVLAQMLDEYDIVRDAAFARTQLVPLADALVRYYAVHYPRGADGKILITPAQSIETYQVDAVNPTPDIAALRDVLPRMMTLPESLTTAAQRAAWKQEFDALPPLPVGRTAMGKLPPLGKGDSSGTPVILPAESYGKTQNGENPELYPVFPYRLYGVGKPDLTLARDTFAARLFPQDTCWGQDGPEAALLGLTAQAEKAAVDEFTAYGNQRFQWFWSVGHDWIPDLDNGGAGMSTVELMLMQTDGRSILLLPAWPKEWTADFKLHAPYQTTVEGHVENGKITGLRVTPAARAKDVVIAAQGAGQ